MPGTNTTYWNATNSSTYESAKSYVPEIPWNNSCGSVLVAHVLSAYSSNLRNESGFCNNSTNA